MLNVSIIVPAHNAMPELTETLQSVVDQTFDKSRMEVIVIDDGSTDGTFDEICRFSQNYPELFVTRRLDVASGTPAIPRNIGIDIARGEYIFFLDADDRFGEQAIEKIVEHAHNWDSDVLLAKVVGAKGREAPRSMFSHNQASVDVYSSKLMWTLAAWRLFRRTLITENGLRFDEAGRPEDADFVIRSAHYAKVVSIASDYDYYYLAWRSDRDKNASENNWNSIGKNLIAYRKIFDFLGTHVSAKDRNKVLMRRLFKRDIVNLFIAIADSKESDSESAFKEAHALVAPFYHSSVQQSMETYARLILDTAFFDDLTTLKKVVELGNQFPEVCVFQVVASRVMCSLPVSFGGRVFDLTDSMIIGRIVNKVEKVPNDNVLRLGGVIEVSPALYVLKNQVSVSLTMRAPKGIFEFSQKCEIEWIVEENLTDKKQSYSISWKLDFDFEKFIDANRLKLSLLPQIKWHLGLKIDCMSYHVRFRIGSRCEGKALEQFLENTISVKGRCLVPTLSPSRNFCFTQNRDD